MLISSQIEHILSSYSRKFRLRNTRYLWYHRQIAAERLSIFLHGGQNNSKDGYTFSNLEEEFTSSCFSIGVTVYVFHNCSMCAVGTIQRH